MLWAFLFFGSFVYNQIRGSILLCQPAASRLHFHHPALAPELSVSQVQKPKKTPDELSLLADRRAAGLARR